ncbi:dihydrolipoyllysine-residue acetyltransferase [Alcanivorax quisquiliarum]|uniref:Acetyltransferase component of pyruvate dehydrogenase complex n=1 Tax=Alcanivorax quisquiliarum TaxID=2933565 RepID=A0ABT0E8J7_9GAMM|nr:dihydrolipoyllysine-residue acetyltransferase [Alcanivorax quisquiliarum]
MSVEIIKVPDTGSSDPVDVIEVPVKIGDQIDPEDTIVVLESDKATVEVPAPLGGKVLKMLVKAGDRVQEGDPLLEVDTGAAETESSTAVAAEADEASKQGSSPDEKAQDEEAQKNASAEQDEAPAASARQPAAPAKVKVVPVPDLGDIEGAELIELHINVGDRIEQEQIIGVLESDKASLEIPSPETGVVKAIIAKVGDKLSSGDALLELETSGADAEAQPPAASVAKAEKDHAEEQSSADKKQRTEAQVPAQVSAQVSGEGAPTGTASSHADSGRQPSSAKVYAGPAVRKLARKLGVDLAQVKGSGDKGRIIKDDVHEHVKGLLTQRPAASGGGFDLDLPEVDFSKFGETERIELNKLRRVAGSNLHRAWLTIPHVTQFDEADITTLEAFRQSENQRLQKSGVKLTMLAFLVKACAVALREFPHFNSSLEKSGEALIQKHYINIGVAVDTPNGLVVPVVRDADRKGVVDIAREVGELAEKARNRKLSPAEMQGGTFSVSSLGGIGGTAFTPIVNWPEVAILGVSRTQKKPVWNGEGFEPRDMLPLSLSYDHRVIDGADAARFTTFLAAVLADMRRALL